MPLKKKLILKRTLIFIACIAALIAVLFIARFIDPRVEFKDEAFEAVVRDVLNNNNKPIMKDDLLEITELDASGQGISSLDGIQYFNNLVLLDLENNRIEDVSSLKNLKNLKDLNLADNAIIDLEKINFKSIENVPLALLNLENNYIESDSNKTVRLSDISLLSQFKRLEELYLENNAIKDISSLSGLINLKILNLRQNDVTDISALKKIKGLKELNLRQNKISDIEPLAGLKELIYLNIHSNQDIKSVAPLAGLTSLHTLIMPSVNAGKEAPLLSGLVNLKRLNMRSCSVLDISFIKRFGKLEELDMGDNYIEDIYPLSNLIHLKILDLRENFIKEISSLENIQSLRELNLRENRVSDISALSGLKGLEYLNIHSNKEIESVAPVANLTELQTLIMENVDDSEEIELLANLVNLKKLNMTHCSISDISFFAGHKKLEELYLADNTVNSFDDMSAIASLSNLKILDLRENYITDISALENLKGLKELNLKDNHITDISTLSELKELTYLNIHSNYDIKSIAPIENLINLQTLIMENVKAGEEIKLLSGLIKLKKLNICRCSISDISVLAGFKKLEQLNLRDNNITDISALSELKELTYLNIHSNYEIKSIATVANLINLQTLIMENVKVGEEIKLLSGLIKLEKLNICNCSVSDMSPIYILMAKGSLKDNPGTGEKASINILGNPVFYQEGDKFAFIRPYWENISNRVPFTLPVFIATDDAPVFSKPGGFYNKGFLLKISPDEPEAKIFYTLDGSEPTNLSNLYTGPIKVDERKGEPNILSMIETSHKQLLPEGEVFKITVIKARTFKDNNTASDIVTNTYIIDESNTGFKNRYNLPLISITTDSGNLFDNNFGILVPGIYSDKQDRSNSGNYYQRGLEWERPVNIEFFEPDGNLLFSQNAGIRVSGNFTRDIPNKSMSVYARDLYDTDDIFNCAIFPNLLQTVSKEPVTWFKSFILRNSGQDYEGTYFRDAVLQSLVSHLGIDTQAYRPAIVFINGEYWGIYNIRERYDEWYFSSHYDIDRTKVVILDNNLEVTTGKHEDNLHYLDMVQFIRESVDSGIINKQEVYEYINTQMDIDNFINYFASEIFFANTDWPRNNIACWRTRTENYEPGAPYGKDGRWRWMIFDLDKSFGSGDRSPNTNNLENAVSRNKLFSYLLKNDEFKHQFINTAADLLNSMFKSDLVIKKIEEHQSVLEPEMPEHLRRWMLMDGSIETWHENIQKIVEFAEKRPGYFTEHLNEVFNLDGTVKINLIADTEKGYIKINSLELIEGEPGIVNPSNWEGMYFKGVPVQITAIPYPGYKFSGWAGIENSDSPIYLTLSQDMSLAAVFEKVSD